MQSEQKMKNDKKRVFWILMIILICCIGGFVVYFNIIKPNSESIDEKKNELEYEANVITDDENALQDAVDALYKKAEEGQMVLEMQTQASSEDGTHFSCSLGNAEENLYDMFIVLYLDDTQEEIYRSGLIPLGKKIVEFESSKQLEEGVYKATIVFNQVEEDRATIHAQVNVGLDLIVK